MRSLPGAREARPLERTIAKGNGSLSGVWKARYVRCVPVKHSPPVCGKKGQSLDSVVAISCDVHVIVDWRGAEAQFYGCEAFQ